MAKISHDLRNLLTTAQLLADRIEASTDPAVRRTAPKLVSSLARAISLCERTLTFGKAEELPPEPTVFVLAPLVAEVLENERAGRGGGLRRASRGGPGGADGAGRRRPAVPGALEPGAQRRRRRSRRPGSRGRSRWPPPRPTGAARSGSRDTGPGLPQKARDNLFQPFRGSVRQGGSGLGLVIAAELVKGHGGTLALEETGPRGSTFRISLPAPGANRRAS